MKKILFILPALALAAGCAEKMETPAEEPQGRLLEISASYCDFSDTDAPVSKAVENGAETEFTDGDAIGVFAVGADGAVMEDCKNVKCVYDEASSTWSGKVYEYADAEYFAYYPYSETMTDAGSAEDVIAAFTAALSSVSDQSTHALYACDLMIAQNAEPNIENSMLTLRFSHAMSMIEITLPQIEYRTSGDAEPYYSLPSVSSSLTIRGAEVSPFVVEPGVYRYIVAPGSASVSGEYKALGKNYRYGTSTDVSAGKYKRIKVTSNVTSVIHTLSVGDFFMSTGELVSKDATLTDAQQADCIGVVFYAGNPSTVDVTLKNDYPNCTHGLVVALDEITRVRWSGNETVEVNAWLKTNAPAFISINKNDHEKDIAGYNNTMAIDYYNNNGATSDADKVDAVVEIMEYRAANPVACGASGWYLPSTKELSLMFNAQGSLWTGGTNIRDEINKNIVKANGTQLTQDYWTSNEVNAVSAYRLSHEGKPVGSTKSWNINNDGRDPDHLGNSMLIRPVMAF